MFEELFSKFEKCLSVDVLKAASRHVPLVLPFFPQNVLIDVNLKVQKIFASEDNVLQIGTPVVIVGDIHGHILDLIRIFQRCGLPPETNYLFLGDLIDRGEFSIETVNLLFLLKILYPSNIHLIRGNHEFESVSKTNNFEKQIERHYPKSQLFQSYMNAFSFMPLAAVINSTTFCVHGGIGPLLASVNAIKHVRRPITQFDDEIVNSILWSDPTDLGKLGIGFEKSPRNLGYLYGEDVLLTFLSNSGMARIIRGHQYIDCGIQKKFNNRCITVFSASNYTGFKNNKSAVLVMNLTEDLEIYFDPIDQVLRGCARFEPIFEIDDDKSEIIKDSRYYKNIREGYVAHISQYNSHICFNSNQVAGLNGLIGGKLKKIEGSVSGDIPYKNKQISPNVFGFSGISAGYGASEMRHQMKPITNKSLFYKNEPKSTFKLASPDSLAKFKF
ncbi:Ser/Thr protein phosphatase [Tritrichomonas foetus]|uniref:Serine/threonine-protein phosphatase n=1 Tax=Tritrichomonas foetus TaxID=1144522 RepID=A0A1J4K8W3_9EUKA|nr:Ser/Thr protein phosphatase [Tritrichomonas foetus]|eukprot:OHT07937.1 Ser/Thr protein phosphatase [Tritrichomonas foetus]